MARHIEATYVAFAFSGDGKPKLSILTRDQRETIDVALDDLDAAMLLEKIAAYLAERARKLA